jgi:hypothetical protein
MKHYNFEVVRDELLKLCIELGRRPTKKEINKHPFLPNETTVRALFKRNTDIDFNTYYENLGYHNSKKLYNTDILKNSWKQFYKKYNKFPQIKDCPNLEFNIPSYNTIIRILGNKKEEFFNEFKIIEKEDFQIHFNNICDKLKIFCLQNNRTLGTRELTNYGFPDFNWFVKHSPDHINTYVDFLIYLGLKPNSKITKELAINIILDKANRLDRPKLKQ